MQKQDCRGIACPQPVLITKDTIEKFPKELIEITVDNEASKENVSRFLKSQGWLVSIRRTSDGDYIVSGAPATCNIEMESQPASEPSCQKILIFIPTDVFGSGDDELGRALMKNFISTLKEMGEDLWRIVLVNRGVTLSANGSPVLSDLQALREAGVDIMVCGTCLEYFDLMADKQVGETTNMLDIVTSMQLATKIIRV